MNAHLRYFFLSLTLLCALPIVAGRPSPTEGSISPNFVSEAEMKADLLQMLANFTVYIKNDYLALDQSNSLGEACGAFRGENTMGSNEQGVRPNADLSMACAFLARYGQGRVVLPAGVSWPDVEQMALRSLVYAYSTHKANRLKPCADGKYWGSVSMADHVWESSLWAMSVAYSAFFQWDKLTAEQRQHIQKLLVSECNYELERDIPTGFDGDTKAEENGWEADVLAATLGLFPDDGLAPQWFDRLRAFAINSYSQADDADNHTIIDPHYDTKTVADYFVGPNLYDDYTLQNHHFFHTSYQNVVIQELGEAALALKLFQTTLHGGEKWRTNAMMHNNDKVMNQVLKWLALADGELAMPNGNDWSLFLYDQITSYSTNACMLRDADALMLENLAYKMIKARQTTTTDGSWLLRADVGARRMGVEAHRVLMTWLMHEAFPTHNMVPTVWDEFNRRYAPARLFDSQNVVRASTDSRFTCFSWSKGKQSYTGYIAANSIDRNKIIVPYREGNTGNFLGSYEVSGRKTNARPVVSGIYDLRGNSYTMNGELNTNDSALNHRFALYSTPGNAVVYLDYVSANTAGTITRERGATMAISVDELTNTSRQLWTADSCRQLDGSKLHTMPGPWVNIDQAVGITTDGQKAMAFGQRANNNSILTAKLYPCYSEAQRPFGPGDIVDRRCVVYYSRIGADDTRTMAGRLQPLRDALPKGWNGALVPDPDGTHYLLLSNFGGSRRCEVRHVGCPLGAPVFTEPTAISRTASTAVLTAEENHSVSNILKFFLTANDIVAVQDRADSTLIFITAKRSSKVRVNAIADGQVVHGQVKMRRGQTVSVALRGRKLVVSHMKAMPN